MVSASAIPVKPKRDISQISSLDNDQIQQIIGIDQEQDWKGDDHQQLLHSQEDWKHDIHDDHSEWKEAIPVPVKIPVPVTRTITVEKHVPIKIYKPIIIEKKVHVPQKVIVEKRVPVLVERIIDNSRLSDPRGRSILPGSNITVSINGVAEDQNEDDPPRNGLSREAVRTLIRRVLGDIQDQQDRTVRIGRFDDDFGIGPRVVRLNGRGGGWWDGFGGFDNSFRGQDFGRFRGNNWFL